MPISDVKNATKIMTDIITNIIMHKVSKINTISLYND